MSKKVLITGATGFIGSNVAKALAQKKFDITAIVREKSSTHRIDDFIVQLDVVKLDLSDTEALKGYLQNHKFDVIIHIGAIRGGRRVAKEQYYKANVEATEQLAINALNNDAVMLFCSSVGVYGAIPKELPANIATETQTDNYYHQTKILAENTLQRLILKGLKAVIIRPAITYGEGDYGFPYTLTKLIHKRLLIIPDVSIKIHLASIEIVTDAFYKMTEGDFSESKIYNIADRYPVRLNELVDFISEKLSGNRYPINRHVSLLLFRKLERWALKLRRENLLNRIRLISYSWFYDTATSYSELYLRHVKTIPEIRKVVEFYKGKNNIK